MCPLWLSLRDATNGAVHGAGADAAGLTSMLIFSMPVMQQVRRYGAFTSMPHSTPACTRKHPSTGFEVSHPEAQVALARVFYICGRTARDPKLPGPAQ